MGGKRTTSLFNSFFSNVCKISCMVSVGRFALRVATSECIKVTQNSQLPALQPNNSFEYADPYTIVWAVSQSDRNAGADLGGGCRGC